METFNKLLDLIIKPNKTTEEIQKLSSIMLDEQNELYKTFYKSEGLDVIVKHLVEIDNNDEFKQIFLRLLDDKNSNLTAKFEDIEFLKYLTCCDSEILSEFVINYAEFNKKTFTAINKIKNNPFIYDMCETFKNKFNQFTTHFLFEANSEFKDIQNDILNSK